MYRGTDVFCVDPEDIAQENRKHSLETSDSDRGIMGPRL